MQEIPHTQNLDIPTQSQSLNDSKYTLTEKIHSIEDPTNFPCDKTHFRSSENNLSSSHQTIKRVFLQHPSSKIRGNERLMIIYNWPTSFLIPKTKNSWELQNIPHIPSTKRFTGLLRHKRSLKCLQANFISQKVSYIEKMKSDVKAIQKLQLTPSVYTKRAAFLNDQILKTTAFWFSTLKRLRALDIELFPIKYGQYDQGFKKLCKSLAKPRKLESLNVSIQKNAKLEGEKLKDLTKSLGRLKHLKEFSFKIADCTLSTSKNITSFFNHLSRMKQLQNLSLKFEKYCLCQEDLTALAENISQLSNLNFLSLDINCSSTTSNDAIVELFENLAIPEKIKKLELQIHFQTGNEIITDKSLLSLEEYLPFMENLTHFSLLISGLKKITNNCPISLVQDISKMKQMKFIELDFIECPLITKYSYAALKDIQNSTKFNIKFGESSHINFLLEKKSSL